MTPVLFNFPQQENEMVLLAMSREYVFTANMTVRSCFERPIYLRKIKALMHKCAINHFLRKRMWGGVPIIPPKKTGVNLSTRIHVIKESFAYMNSDSCRL